MIELTEQPIDCERILRFINDPHCGAEVLFVGTTRRWTQAANAEQKLSAPIETSHLVYEAYREMALARMQALAGEARNRWPIHKLAMVHRLGTVSATEASVAIAVSCPHRGEAFLAANWLIDELKHEVPIWKQEHYVQNAAEWIHPTSGSCQCSQDLPTRSPHEA